MKTFIRVLEYKGEETWIAGTLNTSHVTKDRPFVCAHGTISDLGESKLWSEITELRTALERLQAESNKDLLKFREERIALRQEAERLKRELEALHEKWEARRA